MLEAESVMAASTRVDICLQLLKSRDRRQRRLDRSGVNGGLHLVMPRPLGIFAQNPVGREPGSEQVDRVALFPTLELPIHAVPPGSVRE